MSVRWSAVGTPGYWPSKARRLGAERAVIHDSGSYRELAEALAGTGIEVASGAAAVTEAAALPADWTMARDYGAAGLPATLAAIRRGGAIALANKEALVCAGEVMLRAVRDANATLLPVDSEHNAIFQALPTAIARGSTISCSPPRVARSAPRRWRRWAQARPEAALRHPVWSMGAKISIDSATLMNKGLEVIEAARLFSLEEPQIRVLVHRQSVIHGLVYYSDGSVLAQLGSPDMRIPIAHTLAWPRRLVTNAPRLDLAALGRLDFELPDEQRFPALRLARHALRAGGAAPTILSAANEVAVDAFLAGRIGFLDIVATVEDVMERLGAPSADTLEAVLALDAAARLAATARSPRVAA